MKALKSNVSVASCTPFSDAARLNACSQNRVLSAAGPVTVIRCRTWFGMSVHRLLLRLGCLSRFGPPPAVLHEEVVVLWRPTEQIGAEVREQDQLGVTL